MKLFRVCPYNECYYGFSYDKQKRGHGQCLISNTYTRYMKQAQCFFLLKIVLIFLLLSIRHCLSFLPGCCFLGKKSASNSHKTVISVALVLWLVLKSSKLSLVFKNGSNNEVIFRRKLIHYSIISHIVILRNLMAKVSEK